MHYYDIRKADRELQVFSGHKKAVSYVKFLNANTLVSASTDSQERFMKLLYQGITLDTCRLYGP